MRDDCSEVQPDEIKWSLLQVKFRSIHQSSNHQPSQLPPALRVRWGGCEILTQPSWDEGGLQPAQDANLSPGHTEKQTAIWTHLTYTHTQTIQPRWNNQRLKKIISRSVLFVADRDHLSEAHQGVLVSSQRGNTSVFGLTRQYKAGARLGKYNNSWT